MPTFQEVRLTHTPADLHAALLAASPRLRPEPTPRISHAIHAGVALLFAALVLRAFVADSLFAWSAGLAYVGYDTFLIIVVFVATLPLLHSPGVTAAAPTRPTLGVIVAAYNEAAALPITLEALLAQSDPPDAILIADDGSDDGTAAVLAARFGLTEPPLGGLGAPSPSHPSLRWLRLPRGGKARALNSALLVADTDLVVTVDADTLLEVGAVRALRGAFARDPALVAATGVLTPVCGATRSGRFLERFQSYEYTRNFLSRYAWARMDALLLISGAFAGFRRAAVLAVGGFDPACMVEDYELIHRLRRYGTRGGFGWTTTVVGAARAVTAAPARPGAFLSQRRRWFCGFLQTQYWYRAMVGDPRYGRLGLVMLPIKAFDTLQPLYGLIAFALAVGYLVTGRLDLLVPIGGVIFAKIVIDFAFHLWSLHLYRRWIDPGLSVRLDRAMLTALVDPFTFQILRQGGAALGWVALLTRWRTWGATDRDGLIARVPDRPGPRATGEPEVGFPR